MTGCEDSSRHTTPLLASWRGDFGPFPVPVSSVRRVGLATVIYLAGERRGCQERMILSSILSTGVPAILHRIFRERHVLGMTYTRAVYLPWIRTRANSNGISSSRHTTFMTTTRPRRR